MSACAGKAPSLNYNCVFSGSPGDMAKVVLLHLKQ